MVNSQGTSQFEIFHRGKGILLRGNAGLEKETRVTVLLVMIGQLRSDFAIETGCLVCVSEPDCQSLTSDDSRLVSVAHDGDQRATEGRQVVRSSAADVMTVDDNFRVLVDSAGIHQVVFDAR